MKRALFLDRDGVFNELVERDGLLTSPRNWNEVRFFPGLDGLTDVKAMGYLLILVTNQPCVEWGTVTETFLESMHLYLQRTFGLDAIYYSPSASLQNPRRKPNPGMLLEAALQFGLSLPDSFVLGDTQKDVGAAINGGCHSILWNRPYNRHIKADYRVDSIWEVVQTLKAHDLEDPGMTHGRNKIVSLEDLARISAEARSAGKRVVQCHGVFDLLHPGHIRHFEEARAQGDLLAVTVTADNFVNKGPGRPAFPESLRAETLAALMYVDYVAVSRFPTAVPSIEAIRPHVYVKGQDYEEASKDVTGGILTEQMAVAAFGGRIHFTHGIVFSSSSLLNQRGGVYSEQATKYLDENRRRLTALDIPAQLEALKDLNVLLVGDTIIDEYFYCQPLGKSPKETIVSTRYLSQESFAGGILACANHIADFAGSVSVVTCLGSQAPQREHIDSLLHPKISRKYFFRDDAPTTVKRRYLEPAFLTKMFQIAYLNDTNVPTKVEGDLCRHLKEHLPGYDVVVVADYGHGMLTPTLRELLTTRSKFLALNVQTNSANLGFNPVTKYDRADYVSIDEPELRLALQQKYAPVRDLLDEFALRYPGSAFTITRGHNGSMTRLAGLEGSPVEVPSFSQKIVDRVGAGDAYFAITSLLAARRAAPEVLGFTGNAAGALAVGIVGNQSSLQAAPFLKFIKALLA